MSIRWLAAIGLTACGAYEQRTARVPHVGVPLVSGQPMDTRYELAAGFENVIDVVAPKVGDHSQSVEVPATQLRGDLRARFGDRGQVGVIYERGLGATSERPDPSQTPVGAGDVTGYGASFSWSFRTDTPGLAIAMTYELTEWFVPVVEQTKCNDPDCDPGAMQTFHTRRAATTLGAGLGLSYRTGLATVFAGAFARNHPTTASDAEFVGGAQIGHIDHGPINLLVDAGIDYRLSPWLSALLLVHQDASSSPLRYGPGIGFALAAKPGP